MDIVELVGERVSLTRKGREYVGLCPFHDDHRPSLSVSPSKQIFKCWSCGAGGDAIKFVQLSQRVDFREALATLARRVGIEMRQPSSDHQSAAREQILRALAWARARFQHNLRETADGKRAAEYARQRGISEATIARFELGYAADAWDDLLSHAARTGVPRDVLQQAGLIVKNEKNKTYDRFRNRLMFPICDATGRCVAFGGRTLGDDPAKYLNSPETPLFNKSRILYGLHLARKQIAMAREVVVVEGYTDAVLLSQAGIENVVATLGTAMTDTHAKALSRLSDRIALCFDSDEAGLRAADRAAETALRHRVEVAVAVIDDGKDPADFVSKRGADAFKSMLQSALGALEFRWKRTAEAYQRGGQQGQRDAVEAFLRFVARVTLAGGINDPVDQGQLVNRLAGLLSLPPGTAFELLSRTKAAIARESSSATWDTREMSEYDVAIRRLPAGLVIAVEDLFGLVVSTPESFGELSEAMTVVAQLCDPWRRLAGILQNLVQQHGSYEKADVIGACDDAVLCELISRASERMSGKSGRPDAARSVSERLTSELDLLRMEELCGHLRQSDRSKESQERTFESLRDVARRQHGLLCAAHRWNAPR